MNSFGNLVFWLFAFGNAKQYQYYNPVARIVQDPDGTRRWEGQWENEGTVYFTDPFVMWLCYIPMAAVPIVFLLSFPFPFLWLAWWFLFLPLGAIGFLIFVFATEQIEPQTLGIRQFVGSEEFFRECRVLIISPVLHMTLQEIAGFRTIDIPVGRGLELKAHMIVPADPAIPGSQPSLVEVTFTGSFSVAIDINRPFTVLRNYYDDVVAHPRRPTQSVLEEWQERCRRLIAPAIFAACDPILQRFPWTTAANDIGLLNRTLQAELPMHLTRLGVLVEQVLLASADGDSFRQLAAQAKARLEAETKTRNALADRDGRVAKAQADATAKEQEEAGRQRQLVAVAQADQAIGVADQTRQREVATARLSALQQLQQVATQEADMAVAPLIARLRVIGGDRASALIESITTLDPGQKMEVWKQLVTSVAPGTVVSVANGEKQLEAFSSPALIGKVGEIIDKLGFGTSPTPTPPVPPAPTTP